jgi:hypothetical protein
MADDPFGYGRETLTGTCSRRCPASARTFVGVTELEGALVFAGIPLAVVGAIFAAVFATNDKPPRGPKRERNGGSTRSR